MSARPRLLPEFLPEPESVPLPPPGRTRPSEPNPDAIKRIGPTRYKRTRGDATVEFIQTLKIPDGPKVGNMIELRDWQVKIIKGIYDPVDSTDTRVIRDVVLSMARKNAKRLNIATPIPTPFGFRPIGELVPGDLVFDRFGKVCTVEVTSPIEVATKAYRVGFSDGTSIEADADHQWIVYEAIRGRNKSLHVPKVVTTYHMVEQGLSGPYDSMFGYRFHVPVAGALDLPDVELPLDPYYLGLWLGNGTALCSDVSFNIPDYESHHKKWFDEQMQGARFWQTSAGGCGVRPYPLQRPVKTILRELGLLGNKHIPMIYKRASVYQRQELLKGLIDSDGTISKAGQCKYDGKNLQLINDVAELVRSLGFKVSMTQFYTRQTGQVRGPYYRLEFWAYDDFPVSKLERKKSRQKRKPNSSTCRTKKIAITYIRPIFSVPMRCIQVDSKDGSYLCGTHYKVTHNSSLASCLLLSHLVGPEMLANSQMYSAAFESGQAAIIYRAADSMISQDAELSLLCRANNSYKEIKCPRYGTQYRALSAESRSKHGLNPVLVIFDELAQFGTDDTLFETLKTSMGVQSEALFMVISTQAENDAAVLSKLIDYGRKVEAGLIDDKTFRLFFYTVPEHLDAYDERNWKLANPALGDFRLLSEMKQYAEQAKLSPSKDRKFRNLYLNQRITMTVSLVAPEVWRANGAEVDYDALAGAPCYVGIDLSQRRDLTAMVVVFPHYQDMTEEGQNEDYTNITYDVVPFFWLPEEGLDRRVKIEGVPYLEWRNAGLVTVVPGNYVDYRLVAKSMVNVLRRFDVQGIAFDRWNINFFKTFLGMELDAAGPINGRVADVDKLPWVPFGQGFKDMSPAIALTEEALVNARVRHGMHPVLTYNAACTVSVADKAGNRSLDKQKSRGRIDGFVAMVMAMGLTIRENLGGPKKSVYEDRGLVSLGNDADDDANPYADLDEQGIALRQEALWHA